MSCRGHCVKKKKHYVPQCRGQIKARLMFKSWQQSSTTTLLIQFCSMPQKLLQHYRKTRTCKHSHTQTVTHKITCSGNSFGVCKSGTASQRDTAKENAIPLSPFPGGGSAVLRVQISRTPPESPVRMSPLLRKARHCTNLGFSYFFKKICTLIAKPYT